MPRVSDMSDQPEVRGTLDFNRQAQRRSLSLASSHSCEKCGTFALRSSLCKVTSKRSFFPARRADQLRYDFRKVVVGCLQGGYARGSIITTGYQIERAFIHLDNAVGNLGIYAHLHERPQFHQVEVFHERCNA